jgi:hypothetical protein
LRQNTYLPNHFNQLGRVKIDAQNISFFPNYRLCLYAAILPHPEGRYGQSSRNVKRVAVDAGGGARRATRTCGRQKRVVLASRRTMIARRQKWDPGRYALS